MPIWTNIIKMPYKQVEGLRSVCTDASFRTVTVRALIQVSGFHGYLKRFKRVRDVRDVHTDVDWVILLICKEMGRRFVVG